MKCETYQMLLHQMLDGIEPGEDERTDMRKHEAICMTCALHGAALREIHADCAHLDESVEPPQAFTQGWRQAIRRERSAHTRRYSPRVLVSAAAGLLVVALGTATLMNGLSEHSAQANKEALYSTRSFSGASIAYDSVATESLMMDAGERESGVSQPLSGEKRIRTASLDLRTEDFEGTLEKLRTMCGHFGGYVSDESQYGVAGEDARSAYLSVCVEADQLDAFLAQADTLGQVLSRSITSQDVTDAYADVSGRLESAQARRARLNELVAQASDMSELIELEKALSDVQETIEGYERVLKDWDTRVQYANISVSVQEIRSEDAAREGELGLAARIGGALNDSISNLASFAQGALVALVAALPWAALIAILGTAIYWIIKRRKTPKK